MTDRAERSKKRFPNQQKKVSSLFRWIQGRFHVYVLEIKQMFRIVASQYLHKNKPFDTFLFVIVIKKANDLRVEKIDRKVKAKINRKEILYLDDFVKDRNDRVVFDVWLYLKEAWHVFCFFVSKFLGLHRRNFPLIDHVFLSDTQVFVRSKSKQIYRPIL